MPGAKDIDLTQGPKAQNVITNKRYPGQLLVAISNSDLAKFDMYRVDATTEIAGDAASDLSLSAENGRDMVGCDTEEESFEVRVAVASILLIFPLSYAFVTTRSSVVCTRTHASTHACKDASMHIHVYTHT